MRAVGALGMSIGTSRAFEAENSGTIRSVDSVMFNLSTMIRNAHASYETDDKEKTDAEQLSIDVSSDLRLIGAWLEKARNSKPIQMIVYSSDYSGLKSSFKHGSVWEPKSEKQIAYAKLVKDTLAILEKQYGKLIVHTKASVPTFAGKGIVLTHHVVDLTAVTGVGRLYLLESYTGLIKPFTLWYTKLTGGEELHYMPFNRLTIQIFGDKSTNFKASSHGIKELVKKLAVDNKWTSATTMSRIRGTINNLPDGVDKAGLKLML